MYGQRCESLRGGRERKKKKEKKGGQDFNLALTVWIWKRCSMLPASSLPVWERGALGYSHFHYVLNWADFLPWTRCTHTLGRTHTNTHTHTLTDMHACAHTNTHSVSTLLSVFALSQSCCTRAGNRGTPVQIVYRHLIWNTQKDLSAQAFFCIFSPLQIFFFITNYDV